jgi:peptide/nickel transport system permease protein
MNAMTVSVITHRSRIRNLLSLISRSLLLKLGFALLIVLVLLAVLEPVMANLIIGDLSPLAIGNFDKYLPPSSQHPLGTDQFGRDLFVTLLIGLRFSWYIGVTAGIISTLVAVTIATVAGYMGGKVDTLLNGITNAVLVIPTLPVLIAIASYVRMDLTTMAAILAAFTWPYPTRLIRAQILSLKERPYINLAKISGLGKLGIMFTEILPNLTPFIGVGFAGSITGAMAAEVGFRLLGLGPGDLPSLGLMIQWAQQYGAIASRHYLILVAPALALVLVFIALILINTGLEESFNPRLKKITGM